jgi:ribonuclease P protein component
MRKQTSLRKRTDFHRARRSGTRTVCDGMTIFVLERARERTAPSPARLGVSVSGRRGRAVARNRIKRRLREAFRAGAARDGLDVVIEAGPTAESSDFQELVRAIRAATGPGEK